MTTDLLKCARNERVKSLDGLRGYACLGVFLAHSGVAIFGGSGEWGVSVFLVLSGFLIAMRHLEDVYANSRFWNNVKSALTRIRKIYPLHILTMIAFIPLLMLGDDKEPLIFIVFKIIANIFLLNGWIPIDGININFVAWYITTIFFCYVMSVYILKDIRRRNSLRYSIFIITICYLLQILLPIIAVIVPLEYQNGLFTIEINWIIYYFPLTRVLDFIIGCNLGYLYKYSGIVKNSFSENKRITAVVVLALTFMTNALNVLIKIIIRADGYIDSKNEQVALGFSEVALYTICSCMLILMFSSENNPVTKLLTNKFILSIGAVSPYMFLIHYVVFEYLGHLIWFFLGEKGYLKYGVITKLTVGFLITYILSVIWKKTSDTFAHRFFERATK